MSPVSDHTAALHRLEEILTQAPGVAIAFSGGMDSAFLSLVAATRIPERCLAIFVASELIAEDEKQRARLIAATHGIPFRELTLSVLPLPVFQQHPPDRCYHCKKAIFTRLREEAPAGWVLCDGSNLDDARDFRPGKKALAELGVRSPLVEAGFDKEAIRAALRDLKATDVIQVAQACLATRIPVGVPITAERLAQVEQAEVLLRGTAARQVRFRHHGEIGRIEVGDPMSIALLKQLQELVPRLKSLGFRHITLDLDGYQCGSMNRPAHE